jgi:hypothetical protein
MYRVSYFEDGHFVDECWFDAYEDKEVDDRIEKIVGKLEQLKTNFGYMPKRVGFKSTHVILLLNKILDYIKDLS